MAREGGRYHARILKLTLGELGRKYRGRESIYDRLDLPSANFLLLKSAVIREVNMAKRRNLKKEKALRNEAYARKFRKRPQRGRFGRRFQDNRSSSAEEEDKQEENTTAASD